MAVLARGKPVLETPPHGVDPKHPGRWGVLSRMIIQTALQLERRFAEEGWSLGVCRGCEALASTVLKAWGPLPGYPVGGVLWWKRRRY